MVVKNLIEDLELEEIDKVQRYHLFVFHVFADDEGYLTVKDAKFEANCTELDIAYLQKMKFLKVKNKIIRLLDWKRYQTIDIKKTQMSNIKHKYHERSRKELLREFEAKKSKEIAEQERRRNLRNFGKSTLKDKPVRK